MIKTPVLAPEFKKVGQSNLQRQRVEVSSGGGQGELEFVFNGRQVSVWDDEKLLEIDSGDGCTTL